MQASLWMAGGCWASVSRPSSELVAEAVAIKPQAPEQKWAQASASLCHSGQLVTNSPMGSHRNDWRVKVGDILTLDWKICQVRPGIQRITPAPENLCRLTPSSISGQAETGPMAPTASTPDALIRGVPRRLIRRTARGDVPPRVPSPGLRSGPSLYSPPCTVRHNHWPRELTPPPQLVPGHPSRGGAGGVHRGGGCRGTRGAPTPCTVQQPPLSPLV